MSSVEFYNDDPFPGGDIRPSVPKNIGRYKILELLGQGGMGKVYRVYDPKLDRIVALKMLLSMDQSDRARFIREAKSMAKLKHPNIIDIYDIEEEEEQPYFIMEFLEGKSLSKVIKDEKPCPKRAAEIIAKVARAIQYAHEQGIIHRDIKPDNILFNLHKEPAIMDFGLAKPYYRESDESNKLSQSGMISQPGMILGTPSYMAPEQAKGILNEIGPLSDVYSLGATLYEILTSRPPFMGESHVHTVCLVLREKLISPTSVDKNIPQDLENICLKSMAKEKSDRYQEAKLMAEDLEHFIQGREVVTATLKWPSRFKNIIKKYKLVFGLVSFIILLLIITTATFFLLYTSVRKNIREIELKEQDAQGNVKKIEETLGKQREDCDREKTRSLRLAELAFNTLCKSLVKDQKLADDTEFTNNLRETVSELERLEKFKSMSPQEKAQFLLKSLVYPQSDGKKESIDTYGFLTKLLPKEASLYLNRGDLYKEVGKLDESFKDYTQAISLSPKLYQAYLKRGQLYQGQGKYNEALEDYNQAISIIPELEDLYHIRGELYNFCYTGKEKEAIEDYTKAISLSSNPQSDLYFKRGCLYQKTANLKMALPDYTKALSLSPKMSDAYCNRGNIYLDLYQFDNAISDYKEALILNPKDTYSITNLGVAYLYTCDYDKALEKYTQAINISPEHAIAYYFRGQLYLAKKDYLKSKEDYQKAMSLNLPQAGYGEALCALAMGQYAPAQKCLEVYKEPQLNFFPQRELFLIESVFLKSDKAKSNFEAFFKLPGISLWQKIQSRYLLGEWDSDKVENWLERKPSVPLHPNQEKEVHCQWLYVKGIYALIEGDKDKGLKFLNEATSLNLDYLFEHILSRIVCDLYEKK